MSETYPRSSEHVRLTIGHDEAIANPELRKQYWDERVAAIKAGNPVWVMRGFDTDSDMDPGIVVDYYDAGEKKGFLEGNDLDGFQVYSLEVVEEEIVPRHLNTDPVEVRRIAEQKLEDYITKTSF